MVKLEFYETLESPTIDALWEQGVDMDDWDYVLFIPKQFRKEFRTLDDDEYSRGTLDTNSWNLSRLLTGCCANAWYPVKDFNGKSGILGVAYHA